MNNQYPICNEYDFGETKINPLASYTINQSYEIVDKMTDKDIMKLGFEDEEDMYDYINNNYTITE